MSSEQLNKAREAIASIDEAMRKCADLYVIEKACQAATDSLSAAADEVETLIVRIYAASRPPLPPAMAGRWATNGYRVPIVDVDGHATRVT